MGQQSVLQEHLHIPPAIGNMEKDLWANLFAYLGSEENVRLKFAIDKLGGTLDDIVLIYGDLRNEKAWESFLAGLRRERERPEAEPIWRTLGLAGSWRPALKRPKSSE